MDDSIRNSCEALPLAAERRIDRVCLDFERACRSAERPQIEKYLGTTPGLERFLLLRELLRLELHYRCQAGEEPTAEEYHTRFPEDTRLIAELFRSPSEEAKKPVAQKSPSDLSSDSGEHGRFLPGTVLARRYRIVGLLGRGGMGEVYRADDLKLGQAVALKLLPEPVANNPDRLEHFHNEVRLARQVSHPNVCRVYDIGEADGQHFLSMEYVDGEDLAALIRRIGRLPPDKGVDIARQLCAGLAAAHDRDVLHRDLKPANVMLDGRGRVRITDFGLARLTDEKGGAGVAAGTPAYMAPEQMAGQELTEQSDIYSLGLLLFEVFTGKAARAEDGRGLLKPRTHVALKAPSDLVPDIDPEIERVIRRCLENEPRDRPRSAKTVAASLPGGDPLSLALAAGETPSPEMVAAAGETGTLRPVVGGVLLAIVFVELCAVALLSSQASVLNLTSPPLQPAVLAEKSREVIRLVRDDDSVDSAFGFEYDWDYLRHLDRDSSSPGWGSLSRGRPAGMHFWYRQSPEVLTPNERLSTEVTPSDPPETLRGMVSIRLDPVGRLVGFRGIPPDTTSLPEQTTDFDFRDFFHAADLDFSRFSPSAQPEPDPLVAADHWEAWEGCIEGHDVRVEAASWCGQPVLFRTVYPFTARQSGDNRRGFGAGRPAFPINVPVPPEARLIMDFVCLILYAAAVLIARRNLRLGRGDRKGSLTLAIYVFALCMLKWLFGAKHCTRLASELASFWSATILATFVATFIFFLYLAIEPYTRKLWPEYLISWSRLLGGRFRDPRIGRDLLIGSAVALLMTIFCLASVLVADRFELESVEYRTLTNLDTLLGGRHLAALCFNLQVVWFINGLVAMLMLLLLRKLVRNNWAMGGMFVLISVGMLNPGSESVVLWTALVIHSAGAYMAIRWGMVGCLATFSLTGLLLACPVTADLRAWYIGDSLFALAIVAAVACYGFYTSTANRALIPKAATGGLTPDS